MFYAKETLDFSIFIMLPERWHWMCTKGRPTRQTLLELVQTRTQWAAENIILVAGLKFLSAHCVAVDSVGVELL